MKVDVAYIVSHGFAARMVMQTNLLGELVKKGLKVSLIAPDDQDENLKKYCTENDVLLCQFSPKTDFWTSNYVKARMYFLENINQNTALYEKYIHAKNNLKNSSFSSRLRLLFFKLGHDLKEVFPIIKSRFKRRETTMLESPAAQELIRKINPSILVTTYPVNYSESMLVYAGQKDGIKTVMHLLSWDNISCKGHFPVLADEYIAWGSIMKEELQEYYQVDPSKIHITGVPHFDIHIDSKKLQRQDKYLVDLSLNPNQPYMFFGMSSPRFAPKEIDIVERLAAQIKDNAYGTNMQLVVRPHPQNIQGNLSDSSWLPRLERLKSERVGVDFPNLAASKMAWSMASSDMYKLSSLLAGACVSLNSGSTLSIDAMLCGTPVVITSFDGDESLPYWQSARRLIDYTHLKKLVAMDGVVVCDSQSSLEPALLDVIKKRSSVSRVIGESILRFCPTSGDATKNVVDTLNQIICSTKNHVSA